MAGGILLLVCLLLGGMAAAEGFSVTYQASDSAGTVIRTTVVGGQTYLFLPSCARADKLALIVDAAGTLTATGDNGQSVSFASGGAWDLTALFAAVPDDGQYAVTITAENGAAETLILMFSANLRSLYITSADPQAEGRQWLEDCDDHSRTTSGTMVLLRADGTTVYDGAMPKIRGRGNSTWVQTDPDNTDDKRAYQIKLAKKTDLLDTGDPGEANKRWVLLALYFDPTLLHDWVSNDLALELGQTETSHSTPVDLYYDGEYRGTYLLSEKIEVGTGRVEVADYEDILETLNQEIGVDITTHAQVSAVSAGGSALYATEDVFDGGNYSLGGYLLEMDCAHYQGSQSYFCLSTGDLFVVKNPEFASLDIVEYLAEKFEGLNATLHNYGVNPSTGQSWTDVFDADSMVPYYWVCELAKCYAAWDHQSYFVMEQGESKVRMGPVWDFDKAYSLTCDTDDPTGITESGGGGWGRWLLRIPEFQSMAKQYFSQTLEPIVRDILLGDTDAHGTYLHSLAWYWQWESASRAMNDVLWNPIGLYETVVYPTYQENYEGMYAFLSERIDWLAQEIEAWPCYTSAASAAVTLQATYANVLDSMAAAVDDFYTNATVAALQGSTVTQATDTGYATLRADITLAPKPATVFTDDFTVTVNGAPVPFTQNEDGSVTVSVLFEDPSYRVAEYGPDDYGLVFDADYYAAHYPEVVAEVGSDPAALLAYYVDYGIWDGQAANAFFDPNEVISQLDDVVQMLGEDYEAIVFNFIEYGYLYWPTQLNKTLTPQVRAAED